MVWLFGSEVSWTLFVSYLRKEVLHRIYAFELWADKAELTLHIWYELASNIPGHNAIEFFVWQLKITEKSAFLKATWNLVFELHVSTQTCHLKVHVLLIAT